MEPEVKRYREVGRETSFAMEGACRRSEPGMTEEEVAAVLAEEVHARGMVPTVILIGSDERIARFRHPLPTTKRIDSTLMVVLCARRYGLIASLTRLVHFGRRLPQELADIHRAVQQVDAALILATREGRSVGDIFADAVTSYNANGFGDEWRRHHQGGPTGYQGRSYKARPGERRRVLAPQAFAWNPSITGTKSEDTVLTVPGGGPPQLLTQPIDWPTRDAEWGGGTVPRAEILLL
jgi:antitoxin VapB